MLINTSETMKPQTQRASLDAIRAWAKDTPEPEDLLQLLQTLGTNIGACDFLKVPAYANTGKSNIAEVVADTLSDTSAWLEDCIAHLQNRGLKMNKEQEAMTAIACLTGCSHNSAIAALKEALTSQPKPTTSQPKPTTWQPIATAPSFESVLLWADKLAHGESAMYAVGIKSPGPDGEIWLCKFGKANPTHWMPLPTPPESNHD